MRKLFYMSLESYPSRYTYQLTDWNERVFKRRKMDYQIVHGDLLTTDRNISVGQVLDAHGRTYYSLTQIANLVKLMKEGEVTSQDVIYYEDMFSPGIESLPYIIDQVPYHLRPRIAVRCLAQTIDPDDFVHVWGMQKWMASYEKMVDKFADIILATNEEMVAHMKIAGWRGEIYNISGLAFGKEEVRERIHGPLKEFTDRKLRVGFAARWDQEKQPNFYMDLIEMYYDKYPNSGIEFAVFSGGKLKSNNASYMDRTRKLEAQKKLVIYENLSKNDYYALLNDTRVLFNCALQDWVSNTVSEADTLGCNVLYPAYRSFPEAFANDSERLYIPWSLDDAMYKLQQLLKAPHKNQGKISDWTDGTIDRICDILEGRGNYWLRNTMDYRKHVHESKY
jgi:hypothetical protein